MDVERIALDEWSWVDVARGFLPDAAEAFASLREQVRWTRGEIYRYDHASAQNYSSGVVRNAAAHPALLVTHKALRAHYGRELVGPTLVHYRDGREAMGVHRDTDLRWLEETLIGILTLGARRPFVLRHKSTRDADEAIDLAPAGGDLLVMGGRAQHDFVHAVPKVSRTTGARISLTFRHSGPVGSR